MAGTHECFQALLHVRQDDELADDGVGRFRCDDARLGHADVAPAIDPLLPVPDGGALHRTLHGARTAAGAHVETT